MQMVVMLVFDKDSSDKHSSLLRYGWNYDLKKF